MYALRTPRHDGGNEVAGGLTATMRAVTSQGFIQFHPSLAERLGFKAALFLGHALYWSRHLAKTQPKRNGWFFMTARQWQQATGLTTREQTSVRELLVDQQLLVERVAGKPARMHFRVDLTRLAHWAGLHADEDGTSLMTWEQFSPWMRGCVSFYRPLVDVAGGSVAAALYLSYLLHAQRFSTQIAGAEDGFFPVSQEDVRIALCLGPKTQRNAREKLRQLGLLHERYGLARIDLDALGQALGQPKGISEAPQARRAASVPSDMATVDTRYQASPGMGVRRRLEPAVTPQPRVKAAAAVSPGRTGSVLLEQMVGQESANRLVIKTRGWLAPSSTLAQSQQEGQSAPPSAACQPSAVLSKLEVALLSKPGPQVAQNANQTCPFVETNLPFCRTHIQEQSNTTTTTTGARAGEAHPSFDKTASRRRRVSQISEPAGVFTEPVAEASPPVRQADTTPCDQPELLLPKALHPEWHDAVRQTLLSAPQPVRQQLLDELEGQLGIAGKTIANPPGYLHALIRRHASGELVLAMAGQVAMARRQRERHQALLAKAERETPARRADNAPSPTTPNDPEVVRQARERLMELRKQFGAGGGAS